MQRVAYGTSITLSQPRIASSRVICIRTRMSESDLGLKVPADPQDLSEKKRSKISPDPGKSGGPREVVVPLPPARDLR
jgi:hypothetical protein